MKTIRLDMSKPQARPQERLEWILLNMLEAVEHYGMNHSVDVLDRDFVLAYLNGTNAPFKPVNMGAERCAMLGRDLGELYKQGYLRRNPAGVSGMPHGFPTWVWSYRFTQGGHDRAQFVKADREDKAAA
jgi:hypothetical protein